MEKTVDQTTSRWNNKMLLTTFGVLIIGTNAFNAYIHQQENNTMQIEYEKARSDKKDERVLEQAKQLIFVNGLQHRIKELEKDLDKCKTK